MDLKKMQVRLATHYYLEAIDGIYGAALQTKAKMEADLEKEFNEIDADQSLDQDEKEFMIHSLGDDIFLAEITTELAGEMMVVALYKTVEISIKKMAKYSGLFTAVELDSFFRVAELKKQFKNKVCDIELLEQYKAYDELRCINNAIKHSGVVGSELAAYSGFKVEQQLKDLHKHYFRLKDNVDKFVVALQKKIIAAIP